MELRFLRRHVTPCSPVEVNRRFRGIYWLHIRSPNNKQQEAGGTLSERAYTWRHGYRVGKAMTETTVLYPEDGGRTLLRSFGKFLPEFTASYSKG
jgi:hypothetical protein